MTAVAPTLQAFFTDKLIRQRHASPHTIASYRDTLRLLAGFAHDTTHKTPSQLDWADLDADLVDAFLHHLETDRHNSARTRNTRLAAIRSLYSYAALRHPEHAQLIATVLAIPTKRHQQTLVNYLTAAELAALYAAPDPTTWLGRRDRTLLVVAAQCGLRVSELVGLTCNDITLGTAAHVHCSGKGRKQRITPLTAQTAAAVRTWLKERHAPPDQPLFPTSRGNRLTRSAVEKLVAKHAATATHTCPSLTHKNISPHTLRHSAAMSLLHAGVDTTVIALWLGHEQVATTNIYLHADLTIKQKALARTTPPGIPPGRYQPPDTLLAFLDNL